MHIAFLNPQGNFDSTDRGWTEHPDFGGQLVYVKEVALALGELGHRVDICTRRMDDPAWPEFKAARDAYPGAAKVRILRLDCGSEGFLPKEQLWPHLAEWTRSILSLYRAEGGIPDAFTGHYADGGLAAALIQQETGVPFTFTGHSLGAQKMDKFVPQARDLPAALARFHFDKRIAAERVSMARAGRIVVSTEQERLDQYGHRLYAGAVDSRRDGKFAVIPPGVNLKVFGGDRRNPVEEATARRFEEILQRDIAEGRRHLPVVICSSRLDHKKNHIELVRAWAMDAELRASANLAIVARGSADPLRERQTAFSGEQRDILNAIADVLQAHNLWDAVFAFELNNQAELAACYRHLAANHRGVFALTALYEPFGLAPLEAMAAGLAGVATSHGGPSESLKDTRGEYGVLVDPHDPVDIARGLKRLTRDAAEWERVRRAGMQRVEARYTWERTAEGYAGILADLKADDRSRSDHPIPAYFTDGNADDIGREWIEHLYFG
jgi:sucrose-phosphate synthase